ncbi:MAG: hypothetical protein AAF789_11750 [Bacteroidota bacterium]
MERSKSLSIKSIRRYKLFVVINISILFLFYVGFQLIEGGVFGIIVALAYLFTMIFYWYPSIGKSLKKLKEVSYDGKNLYVQESGYEIQIPFQEVRDVEIISLDGLYKFNLYHHDQFGKEVVCKPSLWYPLNFKRVDKELNRIRYLIRKAKWSQRELDEDSNQLPSSS